MSAESVRLAVLLAWVLGGAIVCTLLLIAVVLAVRASGRRMLRTVAQEFQGTLILGGMDNLDQATFRHRQALVSVRHLPESLTQLLMTTPNPALRLQLTSEEPYDRVRKLLGMQDIVVGNPPFDDAYLVQGGDEGAVRRFLTPAVQAAAMELHRFKSEWPRQRRMASVHLQIGPEWLVITRGFSVSSTDEMRGFVRAGLALYDAAMGLEPNDGIDFLDVKSRVMPHCMVCGEVLAVDIVLCRRCQTPHHRECWSYYGGCSTYGCREKSFVETPPIPKAG